MKSTFDQWKKKISESSAFPTIAGRYYTLHIYSVVHSAPQTRFTSGTAISCFAYYSFQKQGEKRSVCLYLVWQKLYVLVWFFHAKTEQWGCGKDFSMIRYILMIIIIIQKISVAHNPQLKARTQCIHRKTQNKYLCKKKKKKKRRTNRAHHDYHTLDNHTIYEDRRRTKKKRRKMCRTTARKVDSPETTNCTKRTQAHF